MRSLSASTVVSVVDRNSLQALATVSRLPTTSLIFWIREFRESEIW